MPTGIGHRSIFGSEHDRHYNALSARVMTTPASRPWTRYYAPETSQDLAPLAWPTVAALVRDASRKYAANRAFSLLLPNGTTGHLTFAEVDALADAFAVYLREVAGFRAGDRLAVQMPNCLAYPIVTFGALQGRAGHGQHQPALHRARDGTPVRRQRRHRAGGHRPLRRQGGAGRCRRRRFAR